MAEHSIYGALDPAQYNKDVDLIPIRVGTAFYTYNEGATVTGGSIYIEDATGLTLSNCWLMLYQLYGNASNVPQALLASKQFPSGLVSGTNKLYFDEPIFLAASSPEVPRYYAIVAYLPNGGYSYRQFVFTTQSSTLPSLHSASSGELTASNTNIVGNGIFKTGSIADPTSQANNPATWDSFNHTHYGLDIIVDDSIEAPDPDPSVFGEYPLAGYSTDTSNAAVTLGTKFHVTGGVDGWTVTHLQWWCPLGLSLQQRTGLIGYLYRNGNPNVLLATKAFPSPVNPGWNTVALDTPVLINEFPSGNYYIAAVYLPSGGFASKQVFTTTISGTHPNVFGTQPSEGASVGNGVFYYGTYSPESPPSPIVFSPSPIDAHYGADVILAVPNTATTPPVNTVLPAITGIPQTGSTLAASHGTWTETPTGYTYQWRRNGANIGGATSSTYVVQGADVGATITCAVTATNILGSTTAVSNSMVAAAPAKLTIAQENSLPPGMTAADYSMSGAGDPANQGFCREFSVNVGETANFSVTGDCQQIWILRVGWYGGVGMRKVTTITNTPTTQPEPTVIPNSNNSITCTAWSTTASWTVPENATPGNYVALIRNAALNNGSFMPFIVRDDSRPADVMLKGSDATYALAYNYYGPTKASPFAGKSWYGSTGPMQGGIDNRGHAMTYHRPIVTRQGIGQTYPMYDEWPIIRFLERNGVNVTYSSCKDWREGGPTMADCKIYASLGHDEYWDQGMRDRWYNLRARGKKLMFFGGNIVFWRTRTTDNGNTYWCYKDTMTGPGGHVAGTALDPVSWTGTWKDTRPANNATRDPEWNLTGGDFRMNGVNYRTAVVPAGGAGSHATFWRHTNVMTNGISLQDVIGMEADEIRPTQPVEHCATLMSTTVNIDGNRADNNGENYSGSGNLNWGVNLQRWPNNGVTVAFNTCTWGWSLDNRHDYTLTSDQTLRATPEFQQATLNIFADLGALPTTTMAGLTTPTPQPLNSYAAPVPGSRDTFEGESDSFDGPRDILSGDSDTLTGDRDEL